MERVNHDDITLLMNTSSVSGPSISLSNHERILYAACPLCEGTELLDLRSVDCSSHPLHRAGLPSEVNWRGCERCGHLFTDGYFDEEAGALLYRGANRNQTTTSDLEQQRADSARIVDRVSQIRGSIEGRWLDVGFGNGSLLTTADEFGYESVGIDVRPHSVEALREMGYDARQQDFEQFEDGEGFDAISMADVLEQMPFPGRALERALKLMRPGAVLFLSMPNVDTHIWKSLDAESRNPYWGEIEHYHNFSRAHLYWLLGQHGFQPCHYTVSPRYRACMEVCAWRTEDIQAAQASEEAVS